MLHELASHFPPKPDRKAPLTNTDFINLAKKRHQEIVLQSSQEGQDSYTALQLLYVSHAIDYKDLNVGPREELRKRTTGRGLYDLGAGNGLDSNTIRSLGLNPYQGIDLRVDKTLLPRGKITNLDALEALLRLPDRSVNIMANGFLCKDWFGEDMEDYVARVLGQIRRVLPPNGVFIARYFEFTQLAQKVGLVVNQDLAKLRTGVFVFERGLPKAA